MSLTQESVLSLLVSEGGRVKKSELVRKFKGSVDCGDPAEKERNRELFKTFVNNVAVVREIDGVRYVVVKNVYQHLLEGVQTESSREEEPGSEGPAGTGEQQRLPVRDQGSAGPGEDEPDVPDLGEASESSENPTELLCPIQLALQRTKFTDVRVKRMLNFEIQSQDKNGDGCFTRGEATKSKTIKSKPFALPLRVPPSSTRVEVRKLKVEPDDPPESPTPDAHRYKRRPPSVEDRTGGSVGSPQLRRAVKSTKASEEQKENRVPSLVPLEQSEHEWLVKCAAGHWSQAYGLLLRDSQLAEKRDFMSGFTALHWAAKCGNSDMLTKIVDLSRQGGVEVDINARTHGGYTPLHIAALHDQEYIMATLVGEHNADVRVRDNCGKRAYHYLHKGVSKSVREMLSEPKARPAPDTSPPEKEEPELFPDLPKGLHSISRLFQPHVTGLKKKPKQRSALYSLSDDPGEEREDSGFRQRVLSEAFI
ncbi:ankyrin repeat domain-containing protein SOWAHA-like [Hippoglossus hippoglossus]|uniref:ankyrin repeat domain-containing protein SOWAHA-like n=1 Tax=Hippoglossus hippoglossus TaxID=8267 RepID=UPI00148DF72C|nr:ankyrin repeat domain-containing protein SOWAHA-like [Hippoglossus hippoglossus]